MCVATQGTYERAIAEAYSRLILWMEADYGWNRWDAYDLLTHVGRLSVGYYCSGTVGAKIGETLRRSRSQVKSPSFPRPLNKASLIV